MKHQCIILTAFILFINLYCKAQQKDSVTDFDGNIYQTIIIGEQEWMVENLKTTHYTDGTPLVDGTGAGNIVDDYSTKYYFWFDDDTTNKEIYGALYSWPAAMNGRSSSQSNPSNVQGVCPDGWHLPSYDEWYQLIDYLGGSDVAGGKMWDSSSPYWLGSDTAIASNESGFSALPSGKRSHFLFNDPEYPEPGFVEMGTGAYFVSSTGCETQPEWGGYIFYLNYMVVKIDNSCGYPSDGLSVRCVKGQVTNNNLINNNLFKIYPNPSNGSLYIELYNDFDANIMIYTSTGKLIYSGEINRFKGKLNLLDMKRGIYLIRIQTMDNIIIEKIMVE